MGAEKRLNAVDEITLNYIEIKEKFKFLKSSFIKSNGEVDIANLKTDDIITIILNLNTEKKR